MSQHSSTFTQNKSTGQYQVRLQGPYAMDAFGHEVPVTRKDGQVETVKLTKLVWTGIDDKDLPDRRATGQPVALYEFERKPGIKKPFVY